MAAILSRPQCVKMALLFMFILTPYFCKRCGVGLQSCSFHNSIYMWTMCLREDYVAYVNNICHWFDQRYSDQIPDNKRVTHDCYDLNNNNYDNDNTIVHLLGCLITMRLHSHYQYSNSHCDLYYHCLRLAWFCVDAGIAADNGIFFVNNLQAVVVQSFTRRFTATAKIPFISKNSMKMYYQGAAIARQTPCAHGDNALTLHN